MPWGLHAHEDVVKELDALPAEEQTRVHAVLGDVLAYLDATGGAVGPAAPTSGRTFLGPISSR